MRRLIAQYRSRCEECGEQIEVGDEIGWDPEEGTYCEGCAESLDDEND